MIIIKHIKKVNEQIMLHIEASNDLIQQLYLLEKPENEHDSDIHGEGMPVIDQ